MSNVYKEIKTILIIVLAICAVTTIIEVARLGTLNWDMLKTQIFYNAYYGVPLSLLGGYLFDNLDRIVSWDENPRLRVIIGIVGTIVVTMTALAILNLILWVWIKGNPLNVIYARENSMFYSIALLITVFVTVVMHAIGFYKEVQKQKEISHQLEKEKLSSELNALRTHVDPHFLFNSFNVLSGLIDEEPVKAQDFLSGLSKIYRYVLEKRNEDTCKLEDEIAFANRYLDLQKTRFEEGIKLKSEIPNDQLEKEIPSLTLQLLLENAIKHNAFDKENPLIIEMGVEGENLIVKNNVKARNKAAVSNGVGLQNIKDRYKLLSGEEVEIENGQDKFIVKLPLL